MCHVALLTCVADPASGRRHGHCYPPLPPTAAAAPAAYQLVQQALLHPHGPGPAIPRRLANVPVDTFQLDFPLPLCRQPAASRSSVNTWPCVRLQYAAGRRGIIGLMPNHRTWIGLACGARRAAERRTPPQQPSSAAHEPAASAARSYLQRRTVFMTEQAGDCAGRYVASHPRSALACHRLRWHDCLTWRWEGRLSGARSARRARSRHHRCKPHVRGGAQAHTPAVPALEAGTKARVQTHGSHHGHAPRQLPRKQADAARWPAVPHRVPQPESPGGWACWRACGSARALHVGGTAALLPEHPPRARLANRSAGFHAWWVSSAHLSTGLGPDLCSGLYLAVTRDSAAAPWFGTVSIRSCLNVVVAGASPSPK